MLWGRENQVASKESKHAKRKNINRSHDPGRKVEEQRTSHKSQSHIQQLAFLQFACICFCRVLKYSFDINVYFLLRLSSSGFWPYSETRELLYFCCSAIPTQSGLCKNEDSEIKEGLPRLPRKDEGRPHYIVRPDLNSKSWILSSYQCMCPIWMSLQAPYLVGNVHYISVKNGPYQWCAMLREGILYTSYQFWI